METFSKFIKGQVTKLLLKTNELPKGGFSKPDIKLNLEQLGQLKVVFLGIGERHGILVGD